MNSLTILDTNIFIYLVKGTLERQRIGEITIAHPDVVKIESLGYAKIHINELLLLEALFAESHALPLTDTIVDRAVRLRQAKSMGLGDAIVAATALEHNYVLWTANIDDFKHIEGLKLVNPLLREG